MEVVSACPLPVGSIVWQAWSGAVVLSVVAKATFLLSPEGSRLAEAQDPILDADQYWNDDPREALRAATDLVPFKRRAEIVLVGHAYAPRGSPVRSVTTRVCAAGADKLLEVFADRVFTLDGFVRQASGPFAKSPLTWRYAAGGPGTWNPVGIRQDAPPDPYGQRLMPRIQPAGLQITRPDQVIPVIGYGPISPAWPERVAKLHRHAHAWDPRSWNQRPLPQDIEAAYFNVAPSDQHVDAIRAEERILLENLHPDYPRLVTNLSPVTPEAVVERPGQAAEVVPFVCDTMWIDTDRGTCTLSWRARIVLAAANAPGRVEVRLAGDAAVAEAVPIAASTPPPAAPVGATPSAPAPAPPATAPAAPAARVHDPSSIERCAAIAAACALRPADTLVILEQHGLSEDDWDELEHRWSSVLKKDAAEARTDRLDAYDQAYVAQIEKERGPITPEAYARLALAHQRDRDALTRALRELGLPWGASQRIQRVFEERMKKDPALADRVRAAMKER